MARLQEFFEADKRTMEAQLAVIRGTDRVDHIEAENAEAADRNSLTGLAEVWKAHRKPTASSQADMRTAIARFERVNGPLAVSGDHRRARPPA